MKKILIFSVSALTISACGSDKATVEQTEKEVFVIHDEIMPKMGQLMKLRTELSQEIAALDSLTALKSDDSLQQRKTEALALSSALQEADKGMMEWMHTYNGDSLKALPEDLALKAMDDEKTEILEVKNKMLKSIETAEAFLKQ